jgi:CBS domain-containing protein
MLISDIMQSPVYVAGSTENIARARNIMLRHKISRIPIMQGEHLVGIVTEKDIGYRLLHIHNPSTGKMDQALLRTIMTPDPICVAPDCTVRDAATLMMSQNISSLIVMMQGSVCGMVTKTDLLRSHLARKLLRPAKKIMHEPVYVDASHSLDHVIEQVKERGPVLVRASDKSGAVIGVVTERSLTFFESGKGSDSSVRKEKERPCAADVMGKDLVTCESSTRISEVASILSEKSSTCAFLTHKDQIVGRITREDILKEVLR